MESKIAVKIIEILKEYYPEATCSLDFKSPFELLISVILSAQCTDQRVNKTTPSIFAKYSTPQDFMDIDIKKLEELIHPCGFYRNKAKAIKECSKKIIEEFNGQVPKTMEELTSLPGVGRKSANVITLEAFNIVNGVAVDTHAKRLSNKIGFSEQQDPLKIEQDLIKLIPHKYLKDTNHLLVWHGRNICIARNPKCDECPINNHCKYYISQEKNKFQI